MKSSQGFLVLILVSLACLNVVLAVNENSDDDKIVEVENDITTQAPVSDESGDDNKIVEPPTPPPSPANAQQIAYPYFVYPAALPTQYNPQMSLSFGAYDGSQGGLPYGFGQPIPRSVSLPNYLDSQGPSVPLAYQPFPVQYSPYAQGPQQFAYNGNHLSAYGPAQRSPFPLGLNYYSSYAQTPQQYPSLQPAHNSNYMSAYHPAQGLPSPSLYHPFGHQYNTAAQGVQNLPRGNRLQIL